MGLILKSLRTAFWRAAFLLSGPKRRGSRVLWQLDLWGPRIGTVRVLRALGAKIGANTLIEPWLKIQNAAGGSCRNLQIGDHVYIGPDVLFDLAAPIVIESEVSVAGRVSILTHQSVGDRPLQHAFPRKEGAARVGRGSFLGFGCTLLPGVTVEELAVVGTGAVVLKDVPTKTVVVGVPSEPKRTFEVEREV